MNSSPASGRHVSDTAFAHPARVATSSRRGFMERTATATGAFLAILLAIPGETIRPALAQQTCVADSYVPASSVRGGTIAVTDSAMMYSFSNCPASNQRLGRSIRLSAGQWLFFWFRVQGDPSYLSTSQSRDPFILNIYKYNGSVFVEYDLFNMGRLDRSAMAEEARGAGGVFDWRLGGKKMNFDIPGKYKIVLSQQESDITCAATVVQCDLIVEVEQ